MDKDVIEQFCKKLQTNAKPSQIESVVPFLNQYGFEAQALLGAGTYGIMILAKKVSDSSQVAIKYIILEDTDELMECMKQSQCLKNNTVLLETQIPYLEQNSKNLDDLQISQTFTGILRGLLALRENNLIHGDLKPENVLLSTSGDPLIADFGLASYFIGKKKVPACLSGGPSFCMPMEQEVLQKIVPETDYYSAGMLLYRLCGCYEPVEMFQMKSGVFPQISLKKYSELLRSAFSMMSTDPNQRVSPNQIIKTLEQLTHTKAKYKQLLISSLFFSKSYYFIDSLNRLFNSKIDVSSEIPEFDQNEHAPPESIAKRIASIPYQLTTPSITAKNKQGTFVYDADQEGDQDLPKLGPYEFKNGSIYFGQWKQGQRHGRGEMFYKDGVVQEGYWRNSNKTKLQKNYFHYFLKDFAQGQGRIIHENGDVYIGQWEEDKAKGQGKYFTADGTIYDGEWLNDKQHGKGVETWASGGMFEGQYFEGKKQGMGKFSWADGSSYSGEFFQNNIHGMGTYLWSDGRKYIGEWKDNKMNGNGVYSWANGRKYQGEYLDDKKEGYGAFRWEDGKQRTKHQKI